jgi:hypothetical protein
VLLDQLVLLVHKVFKALLDQLVLLVLKESKVQQDQAAPQVH